MKLFPLSINTISILTTAITVVGFFIAGLFKVLDNVVIKALFFIGYIALLIAALYFALTGKQKNRPEDLPQDDSL